MGDEMHIKTNVVNIARARRNRLHGLGYVTEALTAYNAYNASKNGGSGGSGGAAGAVPQPTTATAISPTIQQQFTPQISPVFQQSSGGGSQTASTQQIAPGGQSGQGGAATAQPAGAGASPYSTPSYGSSGGGNLPSMADPFGSNEAALRYGTGSSLIAQQKDNTLLYIIGFVTVAAIGLVMYNNNRSKKAS